MIELDPLAGPDAGPKGRRLAAFWLDQINSIKDATEYKRWFKRGETIEKRYRSDGTQGGTEGARRYNSLWSNVEVLKPALYGRVPLPVTERRFKDKDVVGRNAATILERALRNEIEICGYDDAMQRVVSDYLLPGRGVAWVRYEPTVGPGISLEPDPQEDLTDSQGAIFPDKYVTVQTPKGRTRTILKDSDNPEDTDSPEENGLEQDKLRQTGDRILRESTPIDYVNWADFITFPARARSWKEVTAIGKRVYLSRDQVIKRFGKIIGKEVPMENDSRGDRSMTTSQMAHTQDKCQVYEIWDKDNTEVVWVAMGYQYLMDRKDDPLELEGFFPTPRPLYANPTNNTLVPVPDYIQYQDQAIQIDELTQRIALLTKACKVAGVYNAAAKDISRLFNETVENELIPVDDWAAFSEKGGVEGNLSFIPVENIMKIINELMMAKEKQIQEMDRLTGINDIMRGTSDARETLGGVRLKVNSTGTRLTSRQNEVARFARDLVRIMAEIMARHFSPQSLIEASGALQAEGLGPEDMPALSSLQDPASMASPTPPGPPQVGGPAGPMPPRPPMPPQMPAGAPPAPMAPTMGAGGPAPQPQMSQNVVPFRPPGMQPGGQPGMGMPPQQPQMPMQPPMPQPDPAMVAKFQSVVRIAKAIQLIRDEKLLGFRVDIEVDSTIFPDNAQEKADRTEFITAMTGYIQQAGTLGAAVPEAIPLLAKMMEFGARGYRVSRELETAIEEFADQAPAMAKRVQQAQANKPDPAMIKAQTEQTKAQAMMMQAQSQVQSDQQDRQTELQRQALENEGERANAAINLQSNQMDLEMKLIDKRIEEMRLQMELYKFKQEQLTSMREDVEHTQDRALELEERKQDRNLDLKEGREDRAIEKKEHAEDRAMKKKESNK